MLESHEDIKCGSILMRCSAYSRKFRTSADCGYDRSLVTCRLRHESMARKVLNTAKA
jgi:hypothetical protein